MIVVEAVQITMINTIRSFEIRKAFKGIHRNNLIFGLFDQSTGWMLTKVKNAHWK